MNLLVWSCYGLRNLRTWKELGDIVRAKDPSVMFIAEIWADEARLDMVQRDLDFEHKWVVLKEGRGGGIALFWKSSINLVMVDSLNYYIDTWITRTQKINGDSQVFIGNQKL